MRRYLWLLATVLAANGGIGGVSARQAPDGGTFQIDNQFITGLRSPTAMAFAPDGRLFVTEQAGSVRVITADGELLPTPFLTLPSFRSDGERGLLGIAFDPAFTSNGYIYIFYTPSPGARLSRVTANGNVAVAGSEVTLFEYATYAGNHRGGDLHFGADGKLYLAVGDSGEPNTAQSITSFFGKILRFNKDGSIPGDNPAMFTSTSGTTLTPTGQYRAIWAIGMRNPYRFSFDPASGRMHVNDVGSTLWEEVNTVQAGANLGWPTCEGMSCSSPSAEQPIYVHRRGTEGCAVTGGVFYNATHFPAAYQGNYFVIDYCSTWVRALRLDNSVTTLPVAIPEFSVGLTVAPDGSLYVLNHGAGTIARITYAAGGANRAPTAVASASPTSGTAPMNVAFNGTGSSDPDGDALTYAWDFGDGAAGAGATTSHTYASSGTYVARLTVSDGRGGSHSTQVTITAGTPPAATIITPGQGSQYSAGDTITFSGDASDPDDGPLPASAFSWTVLFHHDAHTHPAAGPFNGVKSGSFTVPTFGHTEYTVYYRIYLTVTDSSGLQTRVTRDVTPRTANITLASNIAGARVLLDGQPRVTPYTFTGVAGVQRTLELPSPQTVNGQTYEFSSWSDNGARSHVIATPAADTTYTATLRPTTTSSLPPASLHWRFDNDLVEEMASVPTSGRGSVAFDVTDPAPTASSQASLRFNGDTGTYVIADGGSIFSGWPAGTTSLWVKIDSAAAAAWENDSFHGLLYKYRILQARIWKDAAGQLRLLATHGDGATSFGAHIASTIAIPAGAWVHLATVHEGTTIALYVNGQPAGSGDTGRTLGAVSASRLDIIGYGGGYSGLFDDLRMYNRALSAAEVAELPNQ